MLKKDVIISLEANSMIFPRHFSSQYCSYLNLNTVNYATDYRNFKNLILLNKEI